MENLKIDPKKIRKLIIILSLVILVIVAIIILINVNQKVSRLNYIYDENQEGNIEIMPLNVSPLFEKYAGRVNQRSVYKTMYLLVDVILQEYYNEFKGQFEEGIISDYFDKNSEKIREDFGITEREEFIKLMEIFKELKGEDLELEEYIIVPDSIRRTIGGLEFVLLVKYKGNSQIAICLEVVNALQTNKTPINCSANVNEIYLNYVYEENAIPEVEIKDRPGKVIR